MAGRNFTMPILSISKLSKSFGSLKVADEVSFDIPVGQALGIIGPNGAGKSTLFNLITGNLAADSGKIFFRDQDITKTSPMKRTLFGIGRSFQIPQPFDNLTVFENLLVASIFGCHLDESAATDHCVSILAETGMEGIANLPAEQLSLLDRKRLELARALATSPELLLLDEIAGGLTQGECLKLVETIKKILANGVTIVWIEHVLHALTSVVERILVLDFGRVIAIGSPSEIMESKEVQELYLGIEV